MGKKLWKILISVICGCFLLVACQSEEATVSEEDDWTSLYTFEETIRPVGMQRNFGVITLNDDSKFVFEGKQSIKLSPMPVNKGESYAYFPFRSDILGFDVSDLNFASSLALDIYAEESMDVTLGLYFSAKAEMRVPAGSFALKKGWNEVEFEVDHSLVAIQYDLTECRGCYIEFEEEAGTNQLSIYIDDIRMRKLEEEIEIDNYIFLDEQEGCYELADFEHAYQQLLATPYQTATGTQLPKVEVVKAAEYGIEAPSGEKVLRLETYPREEGWGSGTTWTQLYFADSWLDEVNISQYAGKTDEYYLKFSIYQEHDVSIIFELNMYSSHGLVWDGVTTKKGMWVEYSEPLSEIQEFIDNPSEFAFSWMNWDPALGDSAVFYLDNIRIEKEK